MFAPVIVKDTSPSSSSSSSVDPKIRDLVTQLEAGLGSVLRRQNKGGGGDHKEGGVRGEGPSEETTLGIITPLDEYQFWAETASTSNKLVAKERAQFFQEELQPLVTEYDQIDSLSFPEDVLELIEETREVLSNVWQQNQFDPPYHEARMAHLMEVISCCLAHCVQRRLGGLKFWSGSFKEVSARLQEGLAVCKRWVESAEALTVQEWKQYHSAHPWTGSVFTSETMNQMINRIEEVRERGETEREEGIGTHMYL